MLRQLRARIEERGFDIDADCMTLFQLFGPPEGGHLPIDTQIVYAHWVRYSYVKTNKRSDEGIPLEDAKKQAIDMIDRQIGGGKPTSSLELFEMVRATFSFPSEIALEAIMRYEAHLAREFDRTLQQIERLRRLKAGQATPPPIEVKLST